MDNERIREIRLALPHAAETLNWGHHLVYWVGDREIGGKMFAMTDLDGTGSGVLWFHCGAERFHELMETDGMYDAPTTSGTTVYDPTCSSGSLLLKVGEEASTKVILYGQEKDSATSSLAYMNMVLHNNPTALIVQGNTLTDPKFKEAGTLKTFDYVVANPPFSDKRWSTGLDPLHDPYDRFKPFGTPPDKQGDYAYLLHIIHTLI